MPNVLIIEDETSIAKLEQDYLKFNGIESDIAETGDEGLRMALEGSYDLILLDLMLPGVDGFELCTQLREKLEIPILMVTARKNDIDKMRGFDRGADDYIVKPFNTNELVARVKAHISRYKRLTKLDEKQDIIIIKGLEIHLNSRQVLIYGIEKKLAVKEFDLLKFLVTNPNIVFSKEHLFDQIWGLESMGDTSTVTVHIRKLREKIEENPAKPQYIETVWGVGYRFRNGM
ncbi:response regulator transcription factor [Fictibacillus phosphorivorans]|uniref:response regulator transcription factor n=1 Tax=Fictibacillus phosphorivorans TaxID=1221500 RepID=UPI00119D7CD3|nr:response regulator transcription factor [Fictibacillus phosphorivorans]